MEQTQTSRNRIELRAKSLSRVGSLFVAMACLLGTSTSASAIIKRHDVADSKYRLLGEKYRDTIVEGIVPNEEGPVLGDGVGTLISPQWIVTAGHVATTLVKDAADGRGKSVMIKGARHPVDRVYIHPDWKGMRSPEDVALIKLSKPVAGAKPACLYPNKDEVGRVVVLAGTGDVGDGRTGEAVRDGTLRGATIRVGSIEANGMQLMWTFKAPADPGVTALEGISAPGDSGGPAFLQHKGKLCIAGVSSTQRRSNGLQPGQYGAREFYTRISHFRSWIVETIAKADTPDG